MSQKFSTASWRYWLSYWPTLSSSFFFISFLHYSICYLFIILKKKKNLNIYNERTNCFVFRERKEEREIVNVALEIEEKTKPNQTLDFFRATKGNFVLFCFFFFSAHLCVKDSNFSSESGLRFVFFFFSLVQDCYLDYVTVSSNVVLCMLEYFSCLDLIW